MVLAITGVTALAAWDEQQEARAVLDDLAEDQSWIAHGLVVALSDRLASIDRDGKHAADQLAADEVHVGDLTVAALPAGRASIETPGVFSFDLTSGAGRHVRASIAFEKLFSGLRSFERAGDVLVIIRSPGPDGLWGADGRRTEAVPTLRRAIDERSESLWLTRAEASALTLPHRIAVAGIAHAEAGRLGAWSVAVVASARSEREREEHARARLLLGVALVSALIVGFGGAALRRRTKELELGHALELAALQSERDEHLVRADKLATLAALSMGVAHEVSTPLGVILARAEQLASRQEGDERTRRSGEKIVRECERINDVVRGFLALARGNAPPLEETDPTALARSAVALVEHKFVKSGVELASRLDDAAPAVACDRRLFEQVLVNLLLNSADACARGGHVELRVEGRVDSVAFVVTDDGEGISPEDSARVAAPFFTTKPHGTGLGLAIAHEIVKHHRGSLTIRPRAGVRGTEVVVALPAVAAKDEHGA